MRFRFSSAKWKSLLAAGLTLGFLPLAQGQSAEQKIVFSSPDGQTTSSAPIPVAQVPQANEMADMPGEAPVSVLDQQLPDATPSAPAPVFPQDNFQNRNNRDLENPMDAMNPRKTMGLLTSAQIMGVPTMEQIFGLPEREPSDTEKNPFDPQTGTTNIVTADGSDEPDWATIFSSDKEENLAQSNKTEKSSSLLGGFFDSAPGNNPFASHDETANDTGFGTARAPEEQSQFNSPFSESSAPEASANPAFSSAGSAFGSGPDSESPFALPKNSSSLETLPQLPHLPTVPGQNYNSTPATTPSWAPKPAPWLAPVPPMGTMAQSKF